MPTDAPQFKTLPRVAAPDRSALAPGRRLVSPLLPVLLPLIVAAILVGVLFAWLLPPVVPAGTAPLARFTNVTVQSGVNFLRLAGASAASLPPTTVAGAVVVFDYNGDGYPDLFFVNGAPWPGETAPDGKGDGGRCALFRNDGGRQFQDVTTSGGFGQLQKGHGIAFGDLIPLVVQFLAPRQGNFHFHPATLEVDPQRDQGISLLGRLSQQPLDLQAVLPRVGEHAGDVDQIGLPLFRRLYQILQDGVPECIVPGLY